MLLGPRGQSDPFAAEKNIHVYIYIYIYIYRSINEIDRKPINYAQWKMMKLQKDRPRHREIKGADKDKDRDSRDHTMPFGTKSMCLKSGTVSTSRITSRRLWCVKFIFQSNFNKSKHMFGNMASVPLGKHLVQ